MSMVDNLHCTRDFLNDSEASCYLLGMVCRREAEHSGLRVAALRRGS